MFAATEMSVHFGGVAAVDGVGLTVERDEILGVIGPNGSGKSTLLNALTGVVPASSGEAEMEGAKVPLGRPERIRRLGILRMFQAPQTFVALNCLENVILASPDVRTVGLGAAWGRRRTMLARDDERCRSGTAALARVGLDAFGEAPAATLTYGQRRLLELARCICAEPRLLMLDEPSAGLNDAETAHLATILKDLRAAGLPLLIVDHKIDFINRICDRLIVLELGKVIAEGPPSDVWLDPRVMDAYLGVVGDA